jgi:hypothetical protein
MNFLKRINLSHCLFFSFYLAVFSFILSISFQLVDPDLPWHLRIGKDIAESGAAPSIDLYTRPLLGHSFIDHEWLFNLIFYLIYDRSGFIALNLIFAFIITLSLYLLKRLAQIYFISPYDKDKSVPLTDKAMLIIMTLTAYVAFAMKPHYGARMQHLGNLLFLLLLYIVYSAKKNKKPLILFLLPPLFWLWANLHGSFMLGLVILWAWLAYNFLESAFSAFWSRFFETKPMAKAELVRLSLNTALASAITLVNPYGPGLYSFLSGYKNNYYMTAISEWRPFFYLPIQYHHIVITAFFVAILFLSASIYLKKISAFGIKKHIPRPNLWNWCLALLFLALSLKSKRHFPLFFIAAFPLMVQFLHFEISKESGIRLKERHKSILKGFLLTAFLVFSVYTLTKINYFNDPFVKANSPQLPHNIVDHLKDLEDLENRKIYNNYGWGGFFLWTLPEAKMFIDGRMPQVAYENHSILEEYSEFKKEERSEEMLKKHEIDLVILKKEAPLRLNKTELLFLKLEENDLKKNDNYLPQYLSESPDWFLSYDDEIGQIYQKK